MQHSSAWDVNNLSITQETPRTFWKPKFLYCHHQPLFRIQFNIIMHLLLNRPNHPLFSRFPTKFLCFFLFLSSVEGTYPRTAVMCKYMTCLFIELCRTFRINSHAFWWGIKLWLMIPIFSHVSFCSSMHAYYGPFTSHTPTTRVNIFLSLHLNTKAFSSNCKRHIHPLVREDVTYGL
jgi:hypothetical protein